MFRLLEKSILWTGMVLALVLTSVAVFLIWNHLVEREAAHYGQLLTERLRAVIVQIDHATQKTFTPSLYKTLHHQTLGKIPLAKVKPLQGYVAKLSSIVRNPEGAVSFYTDCPNADKAWCYDDFLFEGKNEIHREGYNPESRPWYIGAKTHTDWIVMNYVTTKRRISGYPNAWSIAFVKRLVQGADREKEGIWITVTTSNYSHKDPTSSLPTTYLLNMLFEGNPPPFEKFDLNFRTLRFADPLLAKKDFSVRCRAITELHRFSYVAHVQCPVEGQSLQFEFSKKCDHLENLWFLAFATLLILYGSYCFFFYVHRLRQKNFANILEMEKGRLATAIGAKLVHDLKKGIVSRLNRFSAGSNEEDLEQHMRSLDLLNKYINLLGSNLRRERENSWIPLNIGSFKNYLDIILGPVHCHETSVAGEIFLQMDFEQEVHLSVRPAWPVFYVPEISFYRILKNICENYNTYGTGILRLAFYDEGPFIRLEASNAVANRADNESKSTGLGLAIIRQLLEDNFGPLASVEQKRDLKRYCLIIQFPRVEEAP